MKGDEMKLTTLLITGYWVTCRDDEDFNEEFGEDQFRMAEKYLHEMRISHPKIEFELIATIAA